MPILIFFSILYFAIIVGIDGYIHNILISILGMFICVIMVYVQYDTRISINIISVLLFNVTDILITNLTIILFRLTGFYSTNQLFSEGSPVRLLYTLAISSFQFVLVYYLSLSFRKEILVYKKTLFLSALFFIPDFLVVFFLHIILAYHEITSTIFYLICLILVLCTFFTSFIVLYLLNLQQREQEGLLQRSLMEMQLREQAIQLRETEERFETFQIYRHDMKHLLLNYSLLLEDEKIEVVKEDIRKMLQESMGRLEHQFTDHRQLNALIHSKYRHCVEQSIDFQCNVRISPFLSDIDLMILLANIFDNAIEAEAREPQGKRMIRFELIEHPDYLSLVLQNYISESVLKRNPELKNSKSNFQIHGIGLKSIRAILNKKNGIMDIYEENNLFCVHIIYPST